MCSYKKLWVKTTQVQLLQKEIISPGEGMKSWSSDCSDHMIPCPRAPVSLAEQAAPSFSVLCRKKWEVHTQLPPPTKKHLLLTNARKNSPRVILGGGKRADQRRKNEAQKGQGNVTVLRCSHLLSLMTVTFQEVGCGLGHWALPWTDTH